MPHIPQGTTDTVALELFDPALDAALRARTRGDGQVSVHRRDAWEALRALTPFPSPSPEPHACAPPSDPRCSRPSSSSRSRSRRRALRASALRSARSSRTIGRFVGIGTTPRL